MERQIIVTDWKTGETRSAYVDLGPGRARPEHGLLTRPLVNGVMTRGTQPPRMHPEPRP